MPHEIKLALGIIDRSGLAPVLQYIADHDANGRPRRGRKRTFGDIRGPLALFLLNGLRRHHHGTLVEVARIVFAMSNSQRAALGLGACSDEELYDKVRRFYIWLVEVLDEAPEVELDNDIVKLDPVEFTRRILLGTHGLLPSGTVYRSIAVDDTAIETPAALYGDPEAADLVLDVDEEAATTKRKTRSQPGSAAEPKDNRPAHLRSKRPKAQSKLRVLAIDADGRNQYTEDPDARASWATATNSVRAHTFIGYHLLLAVGCRHVTKTNGRDEVHFSPPVPEIILGANLVPGGTHRGESLLPILEDIKQDWPEIDEIIVDPGYSLGKRERFWYPVRRLGFDVTFELILHQRGIRPFAGPGLAIDGGVFSRHVPTELQGIDVRGNNEPLKAPNWRQGGDERLELESVFNRRAVYAFTRHGKPDDDGYMRLRCPFCAGRVRSEQVPSSMRASNKTPLVHIEGGETTCCPGGSGVITVSAVESAWWQRIPYGTTAWRLSYGRRNSAESANSALKGQYTNVGSKYTHVHGRTKMMVFYAFALAGLNVDRIRTFEARQAAAESSARRRARRTSSWTPTPPKEETSKPHRGSKRPIAEQ